jgi:hypothetical protein
MRVISLSVRSYSPAVATLQAKDNRVIAIIADRTPVYQMLLDIGFIRHNVA